MLLKSKESAAQFKNRVLNIRLNHVKYNDWVINKKVDEMAIAHRSLKNVLVGTGGVILVSLANCHIQINIFVIIFQYIGYDKVKFYEE